MNELKLYSFQEYQAILNQCVKLFNRAARAWERGSGSGENGYMIRCNLQINHLHGKAEKLLAPLGISCDYPGLYPSFIFKGYVYNDLLSALDAHSRQAIEIIIMKGE